MIERFACKDFTTFDRISINLSPGINVIIGENGTGKTHLLKAACALAGAGAIKGVGVAFEVALTDVLIRTFQPQGGHLLALRKWGGSGKAVIAADFSSSRRISAVFGDEAEYLSVMDDNFPRHYADAPVYIPAREALSFMKGFDALYERFDLPFDLTYRNLSILLDTPGMRPEKIEPPARRMMEAIEKICGGRFIFCAEGAVTFASGEERYSANATAEGFLQFGVLHRLLENGSIRPGESGPLFWDEPETNLNPKLLKVLAWILLELARNGQQIVLATHSYVLMKYLDLLRDVPKGDAVRYHSLHRDDKGAVKLESVDNYNHLSANSIVDTYLNLYDTEVERAFGRKRG